MRLHEMAMEMAVCCLSPVRTHTRIPARRSCCTASGTPSCSLSSMAATPTRCRSRSTSLMSCAILSSLSAARPAAATWYLVSQSFHSFSDSSRVPSTSVRRPLLANWFMCDSVPSCSARPWRAPSVRCRMGSMDESAPFANSRIRPSGARATTDIRLRWLSNSRTFRTRSLSSLPRKSSSRWVLVRAVSTNPSRRAQSTSATSSGLGPWYWGHPIRAVAPLSRMREWQQQMFSQKSKASPPSLEWFSSAASLSPR
mmetsp:Transcript_15572/g.44168  ORF Transcript_15572/g.44168 Transcript_15572/m.44168 type:complete len:255 (+) Transcript_15572:1647-2411(+)